MFEHRMNEPHKSRNELDHELMEYWQDQYQKGNPMAEAQLRYLISLHYRDYEEVAMPVESREPEVVDEQTTALRGIIDNLYRRLKF